MITVEMKVTPEKLADALDKMGKPDYRHKARTELDALLVHDVNATITNARGYLMEGMQGLRDEVISLKHDASRGTRVLIGWTAALAVSTFILALATCGLVWATLRLVDVEAGKHQPAPQISK